MTYKIIVNDVIEGLIRKWEDCLTNKNPPAVARGRRESRMRLLIIPRMGHVSSELSGNSR